MYSKLYRYRRQHLYPYNLHPLLHICHSIHRHTSSTSARHDIILPLTVAKHSTPSARSFIFTDTNTTTHYILPPVPPRSCVPSSPKAIIAPRHHHQSSPASAPRHRYQGNQHPNLRLHGRREDNPLLYLLLIIIHHLLLQQEWHQPRHDHDCHSQLIWSFLTSSSSCE